MRYSISNTAEYGDYTRGKRSSRRARRAQMKDILREIQSGDFAASGRREPRGPGALRALREQQARTQVEDVGRELRSHMDWITAELLRAARTEAGRSMTWRCVNRSVRSPAAARVASRARRVRTARVRWKWEAATSTTSRCAAKQETTSRPATGVFTARCAVSRVRRRASRKRSSSSTAGSASCRPRGRPRARASAAGARGGPEGSEDVAACAGRRAPAPGLIRAARSSARGGAPMRVQQRCGATVRHRGSRSRTVTSSGARSGRCARTRRARVRRRGTATSITDARLTARTERPQRRARSPGQTPRAWARTPARWHPGRGRSARVPTA
jgi:hypothetical protein